MAPSGKVRAGRDGTATALLQAVLDMTPDEAAKTAYIKAAKQDTIADLNRDMERLRSLGSRFVLHMDRPILMESYIAMRRSF